MPSTKVSFWQSKFDRNVERDRSNQEELKKLARGASEEDLVNSGLEETMSTAYHEIRETQKQHGKDVDLRMASFITALHKIAQSYMERGIFP